MAIYSRKIKKLRLLLRQVTLATKISTCAIRLRCSQSLIHFLIHMNQIVQQIQRYFYLRAIFLATKVTTRIVMIIYPSQMTSFTSVAHHLWSMFTNLIMSCRTLTAHKLVKSEKLKRQAYLVSEDQLKKNHRNSSD